MPVQWYLLKTWAGREEELVREVQKIIPPQMYEECFVIWQERIWRKQKKSIVHMEPLFPGCVFLTCREREAGAEGKGLPGNKAVAGKQAAAGNEAVAGNQAAAENEVVAENEAVTENRSLLQSLEKIPAAAQMMAGGVFTILPMTEEDGQFLEKISGDEHVVRLSYVQKDEEGNICKLSEPLKVFQGQVERFQFKKRYAMVRHRLWGEERTFVLGIVLNEDGGEKFRYSGDGKLRYNGSEKLQYNEDEKILYNGGERLSYNVGQKLWYRGDGVR